MSLRTGDSYVLLNWYFEKSFRQFFSKVVKHWNLLDWINYFFTLFSILSEKFGDCCRSCHFNPTVILLFRSEELRLLWKCKIICSFFYQSGSFIRLGFFSVFILYKSSYIYTKREEINPFPLKYLPVLGAE